MNKGPASTQTCVTAALFHCYHLCLPCSFLSNWLLWKMPVSSRSCVTAAKTSRLLFIIQKLSTPVDPTVVRSYCLHQLIVTS